jgi:hypothetical protein
MSCSFYLSERFQDVTLSVALYLEYSSFVGAIFGCEISE